MSTTVATIRGITFTPTVEPIVAHVNSLHEKLYAGVVYDDDPNDMELLEGADALTESMLTEYKATKVGLERFRQYVYECATNLESEKPPIPDIVTLQQNRDTFIKKYWEYKGECERNNYLCIFFDKVIEVIKPNVISDAPRIKKEHLKFYKALEEAETKAAVPEIKLRKAISEIKTIKKDMSDYLTSMFACLEHYNDIVENKGKPIGILRQGKLALRATYIPPLKSQDDVLPDLTLSKINLLQQEIAQQVKGFYDEFLPEWQGTSDRKGTLDQLECFRAEVTLRGHNLQHKKVAIPKPQELKAENEAFLQKYWEFKNEIDVLSYLDQTIKKLQKLMMPILTTVDVERMGANHPNLLKQMKKVDLDSGKNEQILTKMSQVIQEIVLTMRNKFVEIDKELLRHTQIAESGESIGLLQRGKNLTNATLGYTSIPLPTSTQETSTTQ